MTQDDKRLGQEDIRGLRVTKVWLRGTRIRFRTFWPSSRPVFPPSFLRVSSWSLSAGSDLCPWGALLISESGGLVFLNSGA